MPSIVNTIRLILQLHHGRYLIVVRGPRGHTWVSYYDATFTIQSKGLFLHV